MRKPLLCALGLVLITMLVPLAMAASWQNQDAWTATLDLTGGDGTLTVTPGSGSAWVDGGYSFAKTAKATRTSFKPLYNQTAITIDLWVRCRYATGVQYVISQYVGSNDNVKIIFSGTNVYFDVGTGATNSNGRKEGVLVNGSVYHIVGTWDKSLNGGKAEVFVNGSRGIASAGMTSNSLANDQLYISGADGSASLWKGELYSAAIYPFKFNYGMVNATGHAPDTFFENSTWYWTLNEASGLALLPAQPAFFAQDVWSETLIASAPYTPSWNGQDYWTETLDVPAAVVDISPFLPPWFSLLGMILVPGSLSYPFIKKRQTGDIEFNDLGMAILMFFLGLAFLVGSVV